VPELPEVETVRAGLAALLTPAPVSAVDVRCARSVRRTPGGAREFAASLVGRTPVAWRRRGKFLWAELDDGRALLAHLGMSGQLLLPDPGAEPGPHTRVLVDFDGPGRDLWFVDQRTFGYLAVEDLVGGVPRHVSHIAPDPLDPAFDDQRFTAALRRRRTGLKRALLDQQLISGVGNIYADEALHAAHLHYARRSEGITRSEAERLLAAIRAVFAAAISAGGTSFDDLYVDVNGSSGYFDRSLAVYGRQDQPCDECGVLIVRRSWMNRSSYFCPGCQPPPVRPRP
jgi:formamidopyrimidine-DNA glycosylase